MSNSFHDFARFESVDVDPVVATDAADNVGTDSADLNGELIHLGGAASADAQFEWGEVGQNFPNTTSPQPLSSPQAFDETITGLTGGTDYEFRATATASDGDTDTGGTETFTTDSATQVIDDFNDGDLSEYSYFQGSSGFSTVTSPTYEGAYALEGNIETGASIVSSSLPNIPGPGDTFQYRVRADTVSSGSNTRIASIFGYQNGDDYYLSNTQWKSDRINIGKIEGGSFTELTATSVTVPRGEWLRHEIAWGSSGTITATLFDSSDAQLAQTSATDTSHGAGDFGWNANTGGGGDSVPVYTDLAEIV